MGQFDPVHTFQVEKNESTTVRMKSLQLIKSFQKHRIQAESKEFHCESSSLKQFKCQFCDFETSLKLAADRHKALVHTHLGCSDPEVQLRCYGCNECDFETYSFLVFARHICGDSSTVPDEIMEEDECEQCPSKCGKISKSEHHMNEFHCESSILKQFKCQFCDFETSLKLAADRHKSLAHGYPGCSDPEVQLRCYGCSECDFETYSFLVFAGHICVEDSTLPHVTVELYEREQCPSKSDQLDKLKQHMNEFNCESSSLKQFKCQLCDFNTGLKLAADRHKALVHRRSGGLKSEVKVRCYSCKKCDFETYSLLVFAQHICGEDSTMEVNECEQCQSKSNKITKLKLHMNVFNCESSILKQFECQFCDFKTSLKLAADRHKALAHGSPGCLDPEVQLKCYICKKCDFETYSLLVFARHICEDSIIPTGSMEKYKRHHSQFKNDKINEPKRHLVDKHSDLKRVVWYTNLKDPKKIQYDKCGSNYPYKSKVKANLKNDITFKCKHCLYKADKIDELKMHLISKHNNSEGLTWHKCKECPYKSKREDHLNKHIIRRHENAKEIKWFECEHCTKKTTTKTGLKLHVLNKHVDPEKIEWFKCEHCVFKAKMQRNLKLHVLRKHTDSENVTWFNCEHCIYKAKFKRDMERHILNCHTDSKNIKWHKCEHCEHKSKWKEPIRRHILAKHTDFKNIKWHECEHCMYKSKTKYQMKTHIFYRHTDPEHVKWYKCEHCEYKAKTKYHVRMHSLNHHTDPQNIEWHKCEHCTYKTKRKRLLKDHVIRKHTDSENLGVNADAANLTVS